MRSISSPFRFDGGRVARTTNNDTIVRQKIIDVLTTYPEERFGVPNYGAGVKGLLFEDIDELVESDFRLDAISEVQNRVSGVTIHDIKVRQSELEESTAVVHVLYSLPLSSAQTLSFTVTSLLTEESTF